MREEQVTKCIMRFLMDRAWTVVSYDFPQSGTGRAIHPNGAASKTKGVIVPDIVAVRNGVVLYLENKDRYYAPDYKKVHDIIVGNNYSEGFHDLLRGYLVSCYVCGVGLPAESFVGEAVANASLVDLVMCVNDDGFVAVAHNTSGITI